MTPAGFIALATPGVQGLKPYEPGKPLSELEREYGITDAVKLASNENPLGPSPRVIETILDQAGKLGRYPDGNGFELKQTLAAHLDVEPERITLGNGSNDVLELVARAFLAPGRNAVFSEHCFAVYPIVTRAIGAEARVAPAHDGRRGPRYGHDAGALAAAVDERTAVLFIANPNNPTGTWMRRDELERLLDGVPASVIVVVDEAYFEYVDEPEYPDSIEWLERHPNLVVTRTFSKAYGLAGLRVGYAVSHPDIADLLNRVRQPFNVNLLAQAAAVTALSDQAYVRQTAELNRAGMAEFTSRLERIGVSHIPSVGNFVTIETGRDAGRVYEDLLRQGVIVRPVENYGLPGCLRITIGSARENERALAALHKVLG